MRDYGLRAVVGFQRAVVGGGGETGDIFLMGWIFLLYFLRSLAL